jgi:putative hydrolase of the HAD superfamily
MPNFPMPSLQAISAVFFDLDETLIPDESVVAAALEETCKPVERQYHADAKKLAEDVHRAAREIWKSFEPGRLYSERIGISAREGLWGRFDGNPSDPELAALSRFLPEYRFRAWNEAFLRHGIHDEEAAARAAENFPGIRRQEKFCRPFPESRSLLEVLRGRMKLGLITNGAPDLQREKFAACGLEEFFDAAVVSGELGIGKPEPGIFHEAMRMLGAEPRTSVMIGDNIQRDIAGALGVGMAAVWVNRFRRPAPAALRPTLEISSLEPLSGWLLRQRGAPELP